VYLSHTSLFVCGNSLLLKGKGGGNSGPSNSSAGNMLSRFSAMQAS
jgi:hypothetical protein